MKCLVFDAGPIISLTTNNLLFILDPLKEVHGGEFYITPTVREELVENPIQTKKFKFEALQVLQKIASGVLKIYESPSVLKNAQELLNLANSCYSLDDVNLKIVQLGEMQALALYLEHQSQALVVDERTTRLLIEDPVGLRDILAHRFGNRVKPNKEQLKILQQKIRHVKCLRSTEIAMAAYEHGFLNQFISPDLKAPKKMLLQGVLWGLKLHGCGISQDEIDEIVRMEKKRGM